MALADEDGSAPAAAADVATGSVAVHCNGKRGTFQASDRTVECSCAECDRPGMMPWNVTYWERHCGRGKCKKWRETIRIVDEEGGGTLGEWLETHWQADAAGEGALESQTQPSPATGKASAKKQAAKSQTQPDPAGTAEAARGGVLGLLTQTAAGSGEAAAEVGHSSGSGQETSRTADESGSGGLGHQWLETQWPPTFLEGGATERGEGALDTPSRSTTASEGGGALESPGTAETPDSVGALETPTRTAAAQGKASTRGGHSSGRGRGRGGGRARGCRSGGSLGSGDAADSMPVGASSATKPDPTEEVERKSNTSGRGHGRGKARGCSSGGKLGRADAGLVEKSGAAPSAALAALPMGEVDAAIDSGTKKAKGRGRGGGRGRGLRSGQGGGSGGDPEAKAEGEGEAPLGDGPNAALVAYLAGIRGKEAQNAGSGKQFAVQRCYSTVKKARSPLNADLIKLVRGFGDGILTKRVVGHFAKEEFRRLLPPEMSDPPEADELRERVLETVDSTLASGELGERGKLTAPLRNGLRQLREGLALFLRLDDVRDLMLLRCCSPELLEHFKAACKRPRKGSQGSQGSQGGEATRKGSKKQNLGRELLASAGEASVPRKRKKAASEVKSTPKPKRQKRAAAISADAAEVPTLPVASDVILSPAPMRCEPATVTPEPKSRLRPCKPFSGGWAIMVGLHLAGRPLKKMELVELSAARGLCREPLVKLQRTVGRGGQWYDAWSSCSRLRRIGWVVRTGFKYALTDAGRVEAARYAQECERVRGQMCLEGSLSQPPPTKDEGAAMPEEELDDTQGESLLATQVEFSGSQPEPSASQAGLADVPASQCEGGGRRRARRKKDAGDADVWCVLVDTAEKPAIREALSQLLIEAAQLRLPGVDYAFGRKTEEGDWALADVLVERKTVDDFYYTITSRRAELQARVHASLRSAGFRVAMVLEGVQDMKQQPLLGELLKEAYASHVDVLTTANLRDTAELLTGLVSAANEHHGWSVGTLRALLQPLYEPDPVDVGRAALRALGIEKPVAEPLVRAHGSLSTLLAHLPPPGGDVEAALAEVAASAGLSLYQTGKAFRAMGLEEAPLSRKRGLTRTGSCPRARKVVRAGTRWRRGLLMRNADVVVEVGPGLSTTFLASLRVRLRVQECSGLPVATLRVAHGVRSYLFGVGSSATQLEPGRHWLILPRGGEDWRAASFFAARAYASRAIVSSLCASPEQAARHVSAAALALGKADAALPEGRATWGKREAGLAGILALVRTEQGCMGGFMPAEVANNLTRRLRLMVGCTSLAQLVFKLREEGEEFLTKLGVPDLGARRAAFIRAFLLG